MPVSLLSFLAGSLDTKEINLLSNDETTHTEQLLQAAAKGDRAAVNGLIELHRDYLRRVVDLRMDPALRGRVDASDIVQETQIVIYNRMHDYLQRRPTSFKLWLRGEAIQQVGAQYRRHVQASRRSVRRECSISDASGVVIAQQLLGGTPSRILDRKETADQIRQAVESMAENDREILLLRYVEGLSNAEASEVLTIDPATARKRHGRALKRLLSVMVEAGLAPNNQTRGA